MDQLKEILAQAVKYRFWIAVGIASILPLIAYFAGTGALAEQEQAETAKIKGAYDEVKTFQSGAVKNGDWRKAVEEKTEVLTQDVNASWRKLYQRQAPLLTWPKVVEPVFLEWGRKYPEGVDPQRVRDVTLDYILAYPAYVDEVYKSFKPFNVEDGTGIVAAAPKEELLAPQTFQEVKPPTLGEVWSAQEKLWIQRTILDVIAKVNEKAKAKDWDGAYVKEIRALEVANPFALDQRSEAKAAEVLEFAPEILPPGAAPADAAAETSTAAPGRGDSEGAVGFGAGSGSAGGGATDKVSYVKSTNPDQYFVVPISLELYVEQDHVNDLLVEFSNSPMSIQVLDFEFIRPVTAIKKPRKGEPMMSYGGSGRSSSGRAPGMMSSGEGYLGGDYMTRGAGMSGGMSEGYSGGSSAAFSGRRDPGSMGGMGGMRKAGASAAKQGGVNVAKESIDAIKKGKSKKDEKKEEEPEPIISNPYVNVVEIHIKGQARFYKTPPKEEKAEPESPGATPADAPADPTKADEPKDPANPTPAEPAKTDAPKAEPAKTEDPKAEPPKPDDPKADAPKAEAPPEKAEPPKAEAPKPDAPKA